MSDAQNDPTTVQPGETEPGLDPNPATTEPLAAEQIAELQKLAAAGAEHYDRLLRLTADFDNFKKRAARERDETRRAATEAMLGKLLPVLDNFDMAMAATEQPNVTVETLKVGVSMIHAQLRQVFSDHGAEPVDAMGQAFDPAVHEAVSQQETADVPEGQVVQQLRKGYRLKDRLLRPATVVVAKKPAA